MLGKIRRADVDWAHKCLIHICNGHQSIWKRAHAQSTTDKTCSDQSRFEEGNSGFTYSKMLYGLYLHLFNSSFFLSIFFSLQILKEHCMGNGIAQCPWKLCLMQMLESSQGNAWQNTLPGVPRSKIDHYHVLMLPTCNFNCPVLKHTAVRIQSFRGWLSHIKAISCTFPILEFLSGFGWRPSTNHQSNFNISNSKISVKITKM